MDLMQITLRWQQICLWISIVCVHLANGDKAQRIKDETRKAKLLMEKYWQWRLREAPEFASRCGIHKYDHLLEEYTEEAFNYRISNATAMLAAISAINKVYLSHKDTISLDVMEDMLKTYKMGFPYRKVTAYLPLRPDVESNFRSWYHLKKSTILDSVKGYENLISRYKAIAVQTNQMINLTRQALSLNNSWTGPPVEQNNTLTNESKLLLMRTLIEPFESINEGEDIEIRQNLLTRAKDAIVRYVLPTAEKLYDFLTKEYRQPVSQPEVSLSAVRGGLDLYESCLRWHLSVNMTARQVHDLGLREVERIYGLMEKIKDKDNFQGDVRGYIDHLKNRKENMYNSSEDMMNNIRELMKKIKVKLHEVLYRIPTLPMALVERPAEMGPLGSYGNPPLDKSRPATYYANTYKPETSARFNMMPVVLHEAEPGHHLQAAYNKEIVDLPPFRQATDYSKYYAAPFNWPFYTAYVEGWGLYSEYLGEEFNLYEEPYGLLGRYSGEMLRACRLVVDTGIHAYGWSHQRAEAYIANYTALSSAMIRSEVNRYFSWPGQSCAYKIGELKIKELRRIAQEKLGDEFDLKQFHDRVLSVGPVPLHILEADITAWLNTSLNVEPRPVLSSSNLLIIGHLHFYIAPIFALLHVMGSQ